MKRVLLTLAFLLIAFPAWAGRTVVQTDNFDDNTLSAGSVIWSQLNSINAVMGNAGGQVQDNHTVEAVIRADGTYTDDQYSKLPIIVLPTGSAQVIGVTCRASADTGASRDYYKFEFNGTNPKLTSLIRVNNGAPTTITSSTSITWSVNDTIELECEGTALRGYKNGVLVLSETDSTLTTGKPGITITNTFAKGDNWEGGNVSATAVGFPSTAVLDNFNRADENPVNTNWTADPAGTGAAAFKVSGNALVPQGAGTFSSGYWDTAQFGPPSEIYITVTDVAFDTIAMLLRVTTLGTGTAKGYYLSITLPTNTWEFGRYDAPDTQVPLSTFTQALANGDSVGLGIVGSTLTAYYKPAGGVWAAMGTQVDSTYATGGYLGLAMFSTAGTGALDDFGGGGATMITGIVQHRVTQQ